MLESHRLNLGVDVLMDRALRKAQRWRGWVSGYAERVVGEGESPIPFSFLNSFILQILAIL
jgi:hypothetical protein